MIFGGAEFARLFLELELPADFVLRGRLSVGTAASSRDIVRNRGDREAAEAVDADPLFTDAKIESARFF